MRPRLFVPIAVAAVLMVGCGNLFDPAAAVVDGRKITIEEISEFLEEFKAGQEYERLAQQGNVAAIERQVQQAILSELIRRAVLEPKAEELGVEVTDEEVAEQVDRIREDFESESAFEKGLKESGFTLERLERRIRDNLLEDKLRAEVTKDAGPTEEEIEAFYEENLSNYTRTRAQHIVVQEAALARRLSQQLQGTPKKQLDRRFKALARQYSTDDASAKKGGDLGFTEAGELVAPFQQAANELEIGEVSDPVRSEAGYHVIRVLEREVIPLDEVSDEISQQLTTGAEEDMWREWVTEAYEAADIRVNSRYGELDVEAQVVVDATAEDVPGAVSSPSPAQIP